MTRFKKMDYHNLNPRNPEKITKGKEVMTRESAKIILKLLNEVKYIRGLTSREDNLLKICKEKTGG